MINQDILVAAMVALMFTLVYIMGRVKGKTVGYKQGYLDGFLPGVDEGKQQILKENIIRLSAQHKRLDAERCDINNCQGAEDINTLKSIIKGAHYV